MAQLRFLAPAFVRQSDPRGRPGDRHQIAGGLVKNHEKPGTYTRDIVGISWVYIYIPTKNGGYPLVN